MHASARGFWAIVLGIGVSLLIGARAAEAQGMSTPGSLGGYGAASSGSFAGMGGSGAIIPYAGNFGGFMPYRMGGGGSLSLSTRGTAVMGSPRTSFSLSPMSSGMSSRSGGVMSPGMATGIRSLGSFGMEGGIGSTGGMRPRIAGGGNTSVMPPSFGYPFYQPPSLLGPFSTGAGMPSM
jgi:hypothetical protein